MKHNHYFLFLFLLSTFACSKKITLKIHPHQAHFQQGQNKVLSYQITAKSLEGEYSRSNYVHPLYSLDNQVLTEDFPADHLHHRGIFWAWHQLYVGEKRIGDGWEIKDFQWEVQQVEEVEADKKAKSIQATVLWKSPLWTTDDGQEKPLVRETTTITVHPKQKNYRPIEFEISLLALEPNMRIGGSEDAKGYGGFSPRIRLEGEMQFTSAEGVVTPQNLPIAAGPWMDVSGPLGLEGATAGLTILSHPDNPGYPNPWILRSKNSMQNAVYPHPGAEAIPLSNVEPTVLRYRLLVHAGLNAEEIGGLHERYLDK